MPRRDLNYRFKAHIAKAQRVRRIASASLLVTCLLIGSGIAFEIVAPPHSMARSAISDFTASVGDAILRSLAPIANVKSATSHAAREIGAQVADTIGRGTASIAATWARVASKPGVLARSVEFTRTPAPQAQVAAAATSWLDRAGDVVFRILCPLLRDCPRESEAASGTPQPPSKSNSQQATNSPSIKQAEFPSPAPTQGGTTAAQVAVLAPSPAPPQPVQLSERIREVRTAGVDAAHVDARMLALQQSLQAQMEAQSRNLYESIGAVARGAGGDGSSGPVTASAISGTLTNAINSAVGTILDLTANTLTATNASTTNLTVSATTTTGNLAITTLDCSSLGNGGTLTTDAQGIVVCAADDGGSGSVGGSDTQVQFNDGGSLGGDSGLTFNKTADRLTLVNASTTNFSASYASSTNLFAGASRLGTVVSGVWQGSVIDDAFLTKTGDWTGTLDGFEGSFYLANSFATSSAAYFASLGLAFSTSSADHWKSARSFFATTSADYWETQQTARSADDLTNNSIEDLQDVAAMTENYGDLFAWNGSSWADVATSSLAIALADTTGTLGATRGGTGLSSIGAAGILLGNYSGTGWQQLATSTLGLLTTHVGEGANLYWTDARFDARLSATTSLPNLTTLANLSLPATQLTNFGTPFFQFFAATTTSALAEGANLYYTDARVNAFVHGSSTIPKTYASNTFTGSQIFSGSILALGASQFANSSNFFGLTSFGATGTTTIATNGTIWTPSVLANSATAYSASIGSLTATSTLVANSAAAFQASFGSTATSTFSSSGVLSLAGGLNGPLDARNGVVGATTSIGILYGGTGATSAAGARTNLAAAASGANSDITSLLGLTTVLSVAQGGTGWAAVQSGSLLYGNGSSALATTSAGTAGQMLALLNGVPTWTATSTLSTIGGTLAVGSGGTGATTLTGLLQGNGTSAITAVTGTAGQFPYLSGTNTVLATSTLFLATSGNVGIGVTPSSPLHVRAAGTVHDLYTDQLAIDSTAAYNASPVASILFRNTYTSGGAIAGMGQIAVGKENATDADLASFMAFSTRSAGGGVADRMRITSTGNVGIGQSGTIKHKLHISGFQFGTPGTSGSANNDATVHFDAVGAGHGEALAFGLYSGGAWTQARDWASYAANYMLALNPNGGNVGIGTTTPAEKLDVTGGNIAIDYAAGIKTNALAHANRNILTTGWDGVSDYTSLWTAGAGGGNSTAKLTMLSSGNVGIGTTTPVSNRGTALHVYNSANTGTVASNSTIITESVNRNATFQGRIPSTGNVNFQATNADDTTTYGVLSFIANSGTPYAAISVNGTERLRIDGSGNVGVGTTGPFGKFHVKTGTDENFVVTNGPGYRAVGWLNDANNAWVASNLLGLTHTFKSGASGQFDAMFISSTGNVGISTTTPWAKLSVTGTVGFDGLTGSTGAGSLCLDANKQVVYNSASDSCLSSTRETKHDITPLSLDDLDVVTQLEPVPFVYNGGDGRKRYGFIAEDTAAVDPHLATYDAAGTVSGIDDRAVLSIVVGAIKQLYAKVAEYFARTERLEERVSTLEAQLAASAAGAQPVGSGAPAADAPAGGDEPADADVATTTPSAASSTPETLSPQPTAPEPADAAAEAPAEEPGAVAEPATGISPSPIEDVSATASE